ncbi:MAG: hypothetical protein ACR2PS_07550 [Pseudomonadales bacterium]
MFYGWVIVAGAFLSHFFMIGFLTYSFGLLVVPIQTEFGASRAELMYGMTGSTICGLFFAPVLGALVDMGSQVFHASSSDICPVLSALPVLTNAGARISAETVTRTNGKPRLLHLA